MSINLSYIVILLMQDLTNKLLTIYQTVTNYKSESVINVQPTISNN